MTSHKLAPYKIRQDILSSLVVFFIALPLSLGIALSSGAPPVSAIVAAIIGGLVVGTISGAPLVVSGPAAGLSVMILQYIQTYGINHLFQITLIAGILQAFLGAARAGRFIQKLPKTVIEGVLSAIGFMIVLGQLHVFLGQKIPGGPIANLTHLPASVAKLWDRSTNFSGASALFIGLISFAILLSWSRVAGKLRWIPAALPAVAIATIASTTFLIPRLSISPLGSHVGDVVSHLWHLQYWNDLSQFFWPAVGLAIVASAESLLTAKSLDVLAKKRHLNVHFDINRELMAQGIGNTICGILGGLPITGVMVRSAANLDAGARTRLSTILHSLWIAGFVVLAPQILSSIPLSALAAILIFTGAKLMNVAHLVQALKTNSAEAWVWPATAAAIMSTDLLKGLALGLLFACINGAIRYRPSDREANVTPMHTDEQQT